LHLSQPAEHIGARCTPHPPALHTTPPSPLFRGGFPHAQRETAGACSGSDRLALARRAFNPATHLSTPSSGLPATHSPLPPPRVVLVLALHSSATSRPFGRVPWQRRAERNAAAACFSRRQAPVPPLPTAPRLFCPPYQSLALSGALSSCRAPSTRVSFCVLFRFLLFCRLAVFTLTFIQEQSSARRESPSRDTETMPDTMPRRGNRSQKG